jgi:hypothetical protein
MATFYNWVLAGASREDHVGHFGSWVRGQIKSDPGDLDFSSWNTLAGKAPKTKRQGLRSSLRLSWDEYHRMGKKPSEPTVEPPVGGDTLVEHETFRVIRTVSILRRTIKTDGQWLEPFEKEDELMVRRYRGPVAMVGTSGSLTVNLGDYESAKIEAITHFPCYPEEYAEVAEFAARHVADRIDSDLEYLVGIRSDPGRISQINEAQKSDIFLPSNEIFKGPMDNTIGEDDEEVPDEDQEIPFGDEDSGPPVSWGEPVDTDGNPLF